MVKKIVFGVGLSLCFFMAMANHVNAYCSTNQFGTWFFTEVKLSYGRYASVETNCRNDYNSMKDYLGYCNVCRSWLPSGDYYLYVGGIWMGSFRIEKVEDINGTVAYYPSSVNVKAQNTIATVRY